MGAIVSPPHAKMSPETWTDRMARRPPEASCADSIRFGVYCGLYLGAGAGSCLAHLGEVVKEILVYG
jgi:hypothetical protein